MSSAMVCKNSTLSALKMLCRSAGSRKIVSKICKATSYVPVTNATSIYTTKDTAVINVTKEMQMFKKGTVRSIRMYVSYHQPKADVGCFPRYSTGNNTKKYE